MNNKSMLVSNRLPDGSVVAKVVDYEFNVSSPPLEIYHDTTFRGNVSITDPTGKSKVNTDAPTRALYDAAKRKLINF